MRGPPPARLRTRWWHRPLPFHPRPSLCIQDGCMQLAAHACGPRLHPGTHTAPATPPAARLLQIWDHVRLRLSTSRCLRSAMTGAFCSGTRGPGGEAPCWRTQGWQRCPAAAAAARQAAAGSGGGRSRPSPAQAVVRPLSQPPRPVLACAGSRCSREAALELWSPPSAAHSMRANPRADSSLVARLVLPQPQPP